MTSSSVFLPTSPSIHLSPVFSQSTPPIHQLFPKGLFSINFFHVPCQTKTIQISIFTYQHHSTFISSLQPSSNPASLPTISVHPPPISHHRFLTNTIIIHLFLPTLSSYHIFPPTPFPICPPTSQNKINSSSINLFSTPTLILSSQHHPSVHLISPNPKGSSIPQPSIQPFPPAPSRSFYFHPSNSITTPPSFFLRTI